MKMFNKFALDYSRFSKMKRTILTLAWLTVFTFHHAYLFAGPVTLEKARATARKFLIEKSGISHAAQGIDAQPALTLYSDCKSGRQAPPALYGFNINGGGFIITSANDSSVPVLGYSDSGRLVADSLPCALQMLLESYAHQNPQAHTSAAMQAAPLKVAKSDVNELVKATWDQKYYYYEKCKFNNKQCLTGCVATAMAQVMYYWGVTGRNGEKFQHGCTALEGYTTETSGYTVPAMAAISSFAWGNMPTKLEKKTKATAKTAVSTLIRYCGQSVHSDYGTGSTGANCSEIPYAMTTYFGYDPNVRQINRAQMTATQWQDTIYYELAAGRPVIMSGYYSKTDGDLSGHAFICDGYQASTDKYHINWGWGPYGPNGWFALNALVPQPKDYPNEDYGIDLEAIVGIQPPTGDAVTELPKNPTVTDLWLTGPKEITRDARSENGNDMVAIQGSFDTGHDGQTLHMAYGCGIYDDEGNLMSVTCEKEPEDGIYWSEDFYFFLDFGEELPYGTYTLCPVYRLSGEEEWKKMKCSDFHYVKADVEETTITLTPSFDIQVNGNLTSTKTYIEKKTVYKNTISLTNNGCETTYGKWLVWSPDYTIYGFLAPEIEPGATKSCSFYYATQIKNTMPLVIYTDNMGKHQIYHQGIANYSDIYENVWWDNYFDTENMNIYGDACKLRVRLVNRDTETVSQPINATLGEYYVWEADDGTTLTRNVSIAPGEMATAEFDFEGLSYDTQYDLMVSYHKSGDDYDVHPFENRFTPTRGVVVVCPADTLYFPDNSISSMQVPADALFVDARYSSKISSLRAGGNTNTLYVLPSGSSIPTALEGLNVVVGDQAQQITLEDGYDFLSPIDFTASEISYKRTFTQGHNGKSAEGWSTLVLPFDVTPDMVTASGIPTNWFASDSDSGRKFWLYQFVGDDDHTVTFGYTPEIAAYTPYIIAVPDNAWGAKYDLRNKELIFRGTNAGIRAGRVKAVADKGGKYDFIGRTWGVERQKFYNLNTSGSNFSHSRSTANVEPFRAYFVGYYGNEEAQALKFRFDNGSTTPVKDMPSANGAWSGDLGVFTINGTRCAQPHHGIYIVNGKKVIYK